MLTNIYFQEGSKIFHQLAAILMGVVWELGGWGWGYLGPKNHARKIDNIYKDFQLYKVFMHNFLCKNVSKLLLCILLTRRINTFWSKGINIFWSGGIDTVWAQKIIQEKSVIFYFSDFWCVATFMHNFLCQTVLIFSLYILFMYYLLYTLDYILHTIYILFTTWLTQFCVITYPHNSYLN